MVGESYLTGGKKLAVFYNGACPICAREITFYRMRKGADNLSWVDVSRFAAEEEVMPGLSKRDAHVRFHVLYADGTLVSGAEAYAGLWIALPGFRAWGRLVESLISTRPRDLRLSHLEDREGALAKLDRPKFAVRHVRFMTGFSRLRPGGVGLILDRASPSQSEAGRAQDGILPSP